MKRKRLLLGDKTKNQENEEDLEKKHLPEKYWEGRQASYAIVYLDIGDGEQYPIPVRAGDLINDLLQDVRRLENVIKKAGKRLPNRGTTLHDIYVRTSKRAPLELRCCQS